MGDNNIRVEMGVDSHLVRFRKIEKREEPEPLRIENTIEGKKRQANSDDTIKGLYWHQRSNVKKVRVGSKDY